MTVTRRRIVRALVVALLLGAFVQLAGVAASAGADRPGTAALAAPPVLGRFGVSGASRRSHTTTKRARSAEAPRFPAAAAGAAPPAWVGRASSGGARGTARARPASGIVPPANPKSNVFPPVPDFRNVCQPGGTIDVSTACLDSVVAAIDHAQSTEPTGPTTLSVSGFQHLTQAEQLFAIADLERVARGLPPAEDLTQQLDQVAQTGADDDTDPELGSTTPPGGGYYQAWGANWAGGTYNALATDYYWMYDDGFPSGNLDCTSPTAAGCWGHRDNVLATFAEPGCSVAATLVMGAGATTRPTGAYAPSFAEILAEECSPSISGVVATWAQVEAAITARAPSPRVVGMAPTHDGQGYWIAAATGRIWAFGDAAHLGGLSGHLTAPIVGIAADPASGGFWLVASDGGVFGFGARYFGGEGGTHLTKPIVGIASTWDGRGYWLVASDGGLFAFGDARYHGSEGGKHLNEPIVGMAADPSTGGYWLVASDGGIFAFDAPFLGSEGGHHLNRPIVGMSVAGKGTGYRFVASDGGIFSFRAPFFGSEGGSRLSAPITGMATDSATQGYWLVAVDGGLFAFHADFRGSPA